MATESRQCGWCKGVGSTESLRGMAHKCLTCCGVGSIARPDFKAIVDSLFTTRGPSRGFRKSFPFKAHNPFEGGSAAMTYKVWRLARFHGGADVTMPTTCELFTERNPWNDELDAFARIIAKLVFGTDMAATLRWGRMLSSSFDLKVSGRMPVTAFEGGPAVLDQYDAAIEAAEAA